MFDAADGDRGLIHVVQHRRTLLEFPRAHSIDSGYRRGAYDTGVAHCAASLFLLELFWAHFLSSHVLCV